MRTAENVSASGSSAQEAGTPIAAAGDSVELLPVTGMRGMATAPDGTGTQSIASAASGTAKKISEPRSPPSSSASSPVSATTLASTPAYVKSWAQVLKGDAKDILRASRDADKITR